MLELLPKIPLYKSFRSIGYPKMLPINLTLNVTYHCPSRCQTCNVWKKNVNELTLDEWKKIFLNIGPAPYWLILSGGEPFARKDLSELASIGYRYLRPKIITIPTNGFLSDVIHDTVNKILKNCPKSKIVINFSLDGLKTDHDDIRRLPGSFEHFLKSYKSLKEIRNPRLTIGVHSVISKLNFEKIPEIYEFVKKELKPDSYITEVAEQRTELDNFQLKVFPNLEEYEGSINYLISKMEQDKFKGFSKITQALRINYYKLTKQILRKKSQVIPCYASFASGQISADGEVWSCCTRGESMGNLREHEYDFKKIWFGEKAEKLRKSIKSKECYCPLASASYTNMLMSPRTLFKIVYSLFF